ncbi:ABC transporter ATP-binding protein [Synergistales bacterium]|nr:ABC transporter ATP-binding protein [Synergistales bacterium]
MDNILLDIRHLTTSFTLFAQSAASRFNTFNAVDNVDLTLREQEILGIVGESGGGKSVTGFSILRLIDPPGRIADGEILYRGSDILKKTEVEMQKVRGREIAMIFQDPMTALNPLHTVGRQIDEMLRIHTTLGSRERRERVISLLEEVGIHDAKERMSSYPHQFSGGMLQRVVIATALAARPRLIIADEPTTALDVTVQAQILHLILESVKNHGAALILITHDLAVVAGMTERVAVMYCGKIVEEGSTDDVIRSPLHPYTQGLINSIPHPTPGQENSKRLPQIPGMVPSLTSLPVGCSFAPRCSYAKERCLSEKPALRSVGGRKVACWIGG